METRVSLQPAYVLHSRPFQNTSLLVDFFTLDYGLVRAVARGARREKSRFRSLLQLFQPLLANFNGRGEVKTLSGLDCNLAPINLTGTRLFSGMYLNELLTRLLHNQEEHRSLYSHYQQAIIGLQGSDSVEPILRKFELQLLAEMGYALNLEEDCETHKAIQADACYQFIPDFGFQIRSESSVREVAADEFQGAHLLALKKLEFSDPESASAAKRLLRQALAAHLGEKPLFSRDLFK